MLKTEISSLLAQRKIPKPSRRTNKYWFQ